MMPTKAALLTVLALLSNSANAVDSAYLNSLKYKLIGINLKLPKKIDKITTMEEMRVIELEDGHYVATMVKINSNIQSFGPNRERIRTSNIQFGCSDPSTIEFMRNGMKIGILYKNSSDKIFDQFTYSLKDC